MATDLISIGILFICAIAGGIIAARLKQPTVFGLLLVGAIIGPNALNLVRNAEIINIMADLGAILLTFAIGLEFNVSRLFKSGVRAVLIAFLKFGIVLFMTYKITLFMGLDTGTSLFIGIILSFSSTVSPLIDYVRAYSSSNKRPDNPVHNFIENIQAHSGFDIPPS